MTTIAIIHCAYPTFRHNDLKANNILVDADNTDEPGAKKKRSYTINNK